MAHLSIGQLAKRTQLSIDTIRYYERNGLIAPPARRASGYRDYDESVVTRLRFIRRAKDLGFTLAEIAELMALSSRRDVDMAAMRERAQARLARVDEKLRELTRLRDGLQRLVDACPGHGALACCPIVGALEGERDVA